MIETVGGVLAQVTASAFGRFLNSRVRLKIEHEFSVVNVEHDYDFYSRYKEVRIVNVTNMSTFPVTLARMSLRLGYKGHSMEAELANDGIDVVEEPSLPARLDSREWFKWIIALSGIQKWHERDDVLSATARTTCGYAKTVKSRRVGKISLTPLVGYTMPKDSTHAEELFHKQGHRCASCFEESLFNDMHEVLKVPRPGGTGEFANLRLICGSCNRLDAPTISDVGTQRLLRDVLRL